MPARERGDVIRVLTAYRNRDLREAAGEFIERSSRGGEVLVLAGVKLAADELARACARPALAGVHRYTPRDLASELAADGLLAAGLAPVTRLGREALAARAADRAVRGGELRYFGPVAGMGGFAGALARTLSDLRLDNVAAEYLAATENRGADLRLLLGLFEQELHEHQLADRARRFHLALEAIAGGGIRGGGAADAAVFVWNRGMRWSGDC